MTPERMRIRIAEYFGAKWYWARISNVPSKRAKCLKFKQPEGRWYQCNGDEPIYNLGLDVPDYPNDLQACHEIEKSIPKNLRQMYFRKLADTFRPVPDDCSDWITGTAPALNRCQAFCRTVGIWEDETKGAA